MALSVPSIKRLGVLSVIGVAYRVTHLLTPAILILSVGKSGIRTFVRGDGISSIRRRVIDERVDLHRLLEADFGGQRRDCRV